MSIYWHKRCVGQVVQWEKMYSTVWSRAVNIFIAYTWRSILLFADIWVIGRATMPLVHQARSWFPALVLVKWWVAFFLHFQKFLFWMANYMFTLVLGGCHFPLCIFCIFSSPSPKWAYTIQVSKNKKVFTWRVEEWPPVHPKPCL